MKKQLTPLLIIALASAGCGQEPDATSALPTPAPAPTTLPVTASPSSTDAPAEPTVPTASTPAPDSEILPATSGPHPTNVTPPPPDQETEDEQEGVADDWEQDFSPDEMVAPGVVRLYVSNQSFAEPTVHLTVKIDGVVIADQDFAVEGQHNFVIFDSPVLTPGTHELTADSNTGVSITQTFTLPDGEARYLGIDYWYYPDEGEDRNIGVHESKIPIMFA